jgi:REP element-mobilizing transposase RayT
MAIPSRTARPGTYFITTATHDRRRLFQVERHAALLLETIDHYRASYLLNAYVVMPDHLHLIVTPTDITLERTMQLIKGGFSHRIASKLPVCKEDLPTIVSVTTRTTISAATISTRIQSKHGYAKAPKHTHSPRPTQSFG